MLDITRPPCPFCGGGQLMPIRRCGGELWRYDATSSTRIPCDCLTTPMRDLMRGVEAALAGLDELANGRPAIESHYRAAVKLLTASQLLDDRPDEALRLALAAWRRLRLAANCARVLVLRGVA